jgi:hypothetical protein
MMLRRRRPLMRAAVVGGAGYYAGKKMSEHGAQDANQEQPPGDETQDQPAAREEAVSGDTGDDDMVETLKQVKELHDSGVLTDEEFAAAKQKVLSGS